jgi:hypothetical protein
MKGLAGIDQSECVTMNCAPVLAKFHSGGGDHLESD